MVLGQSYEQLQMVQSDNLYPMFGSFFSYINAVVLTLSQGIGGRVINQSANLTDFDVNCLKTGWIPEKRFLKLCRGYVKPSGQEEVQKSI